MKKYEKQVVQAQLNNEKAVLKKLEANYTDALDEINDRIAILLGRDDADMQHVIYQVEYQKALKTQVQSILEKLQTNEFETISEYLTHSYDEGFLGAMYELQAQGVPLVIPINQEQVVAAIQHETELSTNLYSALGKDVKDLSKKIASEISRGITNGATYREIAKNVAGYANIPKNNAMRIARTEAHRIQETAASHAQAKAKARGADIVKIWDATLDSKTRTHHIKLDGQIRELDKPFEVAGLKAMRPGQFGRPEEDINCRCRSRADARWALSADETKILGDTSKMSQEQLEALADKLHLSTDELKKYSGQIIPVRASSYDDFKRQYDQLWRYEGSDLQKEAEKRIGGYAKKGTADEEDIFKKIRTSVKNIANNHKPTKLAELESQHKKDILDVADKAPSKIKALTEKYLDNVYFVNEKYIGVSKTNDKGIFTNFEEDSKNPKGKWATVFHEIGHAIDRKTGGVSYSSPRFRKYLESDFDTIVKNYQKIYNVNKKTAYKEISASLGDPVFHSISDIVGGITNNECVGRYGHKQKDYWQKPNVLEKEAFAHFYEATIRNDKDKLDAIRSMFPNAYGEFERLVEKL